MEDEVGLRIRMNERLRKDFLGTCKARDTTAAQVLRAFMRAYVEEHGASVRQGQLFNGPPTRTASSRG